MAKKSMKSIPTTKTPKSGGPDSAHAAVEPSLHQQSGPNARQTQKFGEVVSMPHGMSDKVAKTSVAALNQVLADTLTLRDMYKKHHWQVVGPTFNQLHLMYDEHWTAQVALVDMLAERIQILGGIALAMAADVAEETKIPRVPRGREPVSVQLSRLIDAHTMIMKEARDYAGKAEDGGDPGTNDLLVSNVVRTNELQAWFLSEHLVATTPL